mgnify:CR=1 FL=1
MREAFSDVSSDSLETSRVALPQGIASRDSSATLESFLVWDMPRAIARVDA